MNSDFVRLLVTAAFAFSVLILYQRWLEFSKPRIAELETTLQSTELAQVGQPTTTSATPQTTQDALPQVTQQLQDGTPTTTNESVPATTTATTSDANTEAPIVALRNDALEINFDRSGNMVKARLLRHAVAPGGEALPLLSNNAEHLYIGQSGLLGEGLPSHKDAGWQTTSSVTDATSVSSYWQQDGLSVERHYTLAPSGYLGTISYVLTNESEQSYTGHAYFQFLRDRNPPTSYSKLIPSYFGAAIYTEADKYAKHDFDDLEDYPKRTSDGWIGIVQRYFLGAWLDGGTQRENYMNDAGNNNVAIGIIRAVGPVAPGASITLVQPFFLGALEQDLLEGLDAAAAPNISLAVDYGWLSFICRPLFWLLEWIEQVVGNWGLAIILLTFLIKLVFFPLMSKSYRSMAKLKTFAPEMQKLKERFGEDRQAMQKSMLELYRKEKINPLGGCMPVLVQIPVFISLYWMLLESVELRHAPFYGWLTDLSGPDPYYVLPMLLGVAMFGQFKVNPTPPDPTQAMVMKLMPIGFAAFSIFFPSGLVIYWLTNTILSVAQQWYITRSIAKPTTKKLD